MRLITTFTLVCFVFTCVYLYIQYLSRFYDKPRGSVNLKKLNKKRQNMFNLVTLKIVTPDDRKKKNGTAIVTTNTTAEDKSREIVCQNETGKIPKLTYRNGGVAMHNFPYIHRNRHFCLSKEKYLYFMYVFSAPTHFARRALIRKSWGNQQVFRNPLGKLAFMLGRNANRAMQRLIEREYRIYGDIVQEDFIESYYNLSFKGIMAFRWITENCKNVDFVMKVDDDQFLNIFRAIDIMHTKGLEAKRTFFCLLFAANTSLVLRGRSKYFVHPKQYSGRFFPPYCSGQTWIATRDVIDDLYHASFRVPYMPIEDAYSTGILAKEAGNVTRVVEPGGWFEYPELYRATNIEPPLFGDIPVSEHMSLWHYLIKSASPKFKTLINPKYVKQLDDEISSLKTASKN